MTKSQIIKEIQVRTDLPLITCIKLYNKTYNLEAAVELARKDFPARATLVNVRREEKHDN